MERQRILNVSGLVESLIVVDTEGQGRSPAPGVAPTPPICGLKNRAATDDITTNALNAMHLRHIRPEAQIPGSSSYAIRWGR